MQHRFQIFHLTQIFIKEKCFNLTSKKDVNHFYFIQQ